MSSSSAIAPELKYSLLMGILRVVVHTLTAFRLFFVMVPVLSERMWLEVNGSEKKHVMWPSSSIMPALRTWMCSWSSSKQSRSHSMK